MARKRITVGQQKFGFADGDLKTPLHDEIVLWLKKNALELSKRLIGWRDSWNPERVEKMRRRCVEAVEQRRKELQTDLNAGLLWRHSNDRDLVWQNPRSRPARLRQMQEEL